MSSDRSVRHIALLGSTGSIGVATLDVVRQHPDLYQVVSLVAGRNVSRLIEQIETFQPQWVGVETPRDEQMIKARFPKLTVLCGAEGVMGAVELPEVDTIVSAITGTVALKATFRAIERGLRICLANKETLVAAGELINRALDQSSAQIVPIDSEQSAIFQALSGLETRGVKRLILTASGGPFLGRKRAELAEVKPEQALAHPRWSMGRKISIDSATLMNKALEMIETQVLFRVPQELIEVWIHPQSLVHSLVEFDDCSLLAQLAVTDMRLPIQFALSHPKRVLSAFPRLDLTRSEPLTFQEVDHEAFPAIRLAQAVMRRGGGFGAVFNAANEVAVDAFLAHRLSFVAISDVVAEVLQRSDFSPPQDCAELEALISESKRMSDKIIQIRSY